MCVRMNGWTHFPTLPTPPPSLSLPSLPCFPKYLYVVSSLRSSPSPLCFLLPLAKDLLYPSAVIGLLSQFGVFEGKKKTWHLFGKVCIYVPRYKYMCLHITLMLSNGRFTYTHIRVGKFSSRNDTSRVHPPSSAKYCVYPKYERSELPI